MPLSYDRAAFFASVRATVFAGTMVQSQVDGCEAILGEAERRGGLDARFVAYMLATAFWETARTMQPVAEIGHGRSKAYGKPDPVTGKVYYGRGLVQLTWKANYQKMGLVCGVDLVADPDLALGLNVAVKIMFEGMLKGAFTGKKLSTYFTASTTDWVNARRIINGTDHAATIGVMGASFHKALVSTVAAASENDASAHVAAVLDASASDQKRAQSATTSKGAPAVAGVAAVVATGVGSTGHVHWALIIGAVILVGLIIDGLVVWSKLSAAKSLALSATAQAGASSPPAAPVPELPKV